MAARSPKRVSLSGFATPPNPDPNSNSGSHESVATDSPRPRHSGSGTSPIAPSLRSRVVSASNVSFNLTSVGGPASVSGSRKHVSDVIHGSGSGLDSPPHTHGFGTSPEGSGTAAAVKRSVAGGSIGNLLRGKKTTSASSASLLAGGGGGGGSALDSNNPNEYDRNDFREWYAQLMTDVAQNLPFAPSGDNIPPAQPTDFTLWSSKTVFGPILVPISDFLDQASQFQLGEFARISSGDLPPIPTASAKPTPIHATPFGQIKPLDLTNPDASANVQFIVDVLTSTTAGLPTSGSMSLNSSDHSSSRTHHSKSTSASSSSPARSIRNVRDLDDASVYSLLATHRSYMPSAQLLKTLMDVFHDPIRKLPPNAIGATSRVSIQRNIEKILRAWINVFWDDIVLAQDAVKEFQKWVNELAHGPKVLAGLGQQGDGDGGAVADDGGMYHYASCSLKPLLMTRIGGDAMSRLLSAAGVGSSTAATASAAPRSPSPNSPASPTSHAGSGAASGSTSPTHSSSASAAPITPLTPTATSLDTIPLGLLALHLHLADRYYASALTVPVLDALARTGYPRTHTHVRIIREYLSYTTGLFRWVLFSIDAAGPAPKRRVLVVKRMLKLAAQARELGALNAMCTIVGAIRSPWVVYQAGVWEALSGKYIRMMRELGEYVDPSDAFVGYREMVILAGSGVTKIPFIALHLVLAQHTQVADPTSPMSSTRWLSLYLPFIKILLEIQSATGATQPSSPPDPVLLSLVSSAPAFNLVRAWAKDIKLGSVADVNTYIAKYRAATAATAALAGSNAGGGSKMFKSLSGSVATLLGGGMGSAGKRAASKATLATVLDASGNREGDNKAGADQERERDRDKDAANLFGLGRVSTVSMEMDAQQQQEPQVADASVAGLAAVGAGEKAASAQDEEAKVDPSGKKTDAVEATNPSLPDS